MKKLLCDCFAVRTVSNFLYSATLALALVLAGCAATKSASAPEPRSVDGDAASAALHEQALRALDARMFVIKGDEFYLPGETISGQLHFHAGDACRHPAVTQPLSPQYVAHPEHRGRCCRNDVAQTQAQRRPAVPALDRRPPNRAGPGGDRDAV